MKHASDCALHSAPAYPAGPCNCGAIDYEALAIRVETEEPTPELTSAVLTAFGCESEEGGAPEPLTRVDDARGFCPFHWACWAMIGPKGPDHLWFATIARRRAEVFLNAEAPTEARARTAANLRAKALEARNA